MPGRGFDPRRLHNDEADWKNFPVRFFIFFQQKNDFKWVHSKSFYTLKLVSRASYPSPGRWLDLHWLSQAMRVHYFGYQFVVIE